jgi:hypothetical protein
MIIVKIMGGLGNQLQQYALAEKLESMGKQVKLDISEYEHPEAMGTPRQLELKHFPGITYECCTEEEKQQLLGKPDIFSRIRMRLDPDRRRLYRETPVMYDEAIFSFQDMYLEGYFACEKYYIDRIDVLREKLAFPVKEGSVNARMAAAMAEEESVSIHLRRGDYLNPENQSIFEHICTDSYYAKAEEYIRQRCEHPHFYVFSDDTAYAADRYRGEEYTIVDVNHGEDNYFDMYLMSRCRHNICANSTFSFWGARLNSHPDKITVRPLKQKNSNQYQPEIMRRLWTGWVLIDEQGSVV